MSPTEKQIVVLLKRKQEIDDLNAAGTFVSNPKGLLDAIEGLLRSELDMREQLRNAGLLR